jgi:hypothetical protein
VKKSIFNLLFVSFLHSEYLYLGGGKEIYLIPKRDVKSSRNLKFFEKENGETIALSNTFFIKSKLEAEVFEKRYEVELVKKYSKSLYLFKSSENIFSIFKKLRSDNLIIDVYPNVYKRAYLR